MKLNIIYIIIGIIWVLYRMYKKAGEGKPTSSSTMPQSNVEKPNDIKSIFDDFMRGEEIKKVLNVPVEIKKESLKIKTPHKIKSKINTTMPGNSTTPSVRQTSPVYSVESALHPDYLASFDLKQAIIFSEIINRPYE